MIEIIAAEATVPLVDKNWRKKKIYAFKILIAILGYLEAKFDYDYFILFLHLGPTILHKKFHVIWSKIEDFTTVLSFSKIGL